MYNVDPVLLFKKLIVPIRHHQQSQWLLRLAVFYFLLPDEIPTTTKARFKRRTLHVPNLVAIRVDSNN